MGGGNRRPLGARASGARRRSSLSRNVRAYAKCERDKMLARSATSREHLGEAAAELHMRC